MLYIHCTIGVNYWVAQFAGASYTCVGPTHVIELGFKPRPDLYYIILYK